MAVWLNIFGQNKISTDITDIQKYWDKIIPSISIDLLFLKDSLDDSSDKGLVRKDYYTYDKKYWEIQAFNIEGNEHICFSYPIFCDDIAKTDCIKVIFYNDIISVLGLFDHFHLWFKMTSSKTLREGYGKIVNEIFKSFKSPFAIYCTEWDEEGDLSFMEIYKYCIDNQTNQAEKLELMNMNEFFIVKYSDN